jgi:DNA modification methylase
MIPEQIVNTQPVVNMPNIKKEIIRESNKKGFNELTPSDWAKLSKSVWNDVSSPREWYHLEHGATFSVALAERAIKMYTKKGDLVLDPFLGVGSTLVAAKRLNRNGIGFELYKKFVDVATKVLDQKDLFTKSEQKIIHDDARNLLNYVKPNTVQLMVTSPPYANFIHKAVEDRKLTHKKSLLVLNNKSSVKPYGDDERDFGNYNYNRFLEEVKEVMRKLFVVTKSGGYNIWVVKDCRDTQHNKPYIPFHTDVGKIGEEVGFKWHDLIVWDQNAQRTLVLLGFPSVFYVNINHTFLVVLRKPYK